MEVYQKKSYNKVRKAYEAARNENDQYIIAGSLSDKTPYGKSPKGVPYKTTRQFVKALRSAERRWAKKVNHAKKTELAWCKEYSPKTYPQAKKDYDKFYKAYKHLL